MGIVLVVGTIALFIAILQRSQSVERVEMPIEIKKTVEIEPAKPEVVCNYKDADIQVNSEVISATTNNNTLTIVTSKQVTPSVSAITEGNHLTFNAVTASIQQQVIVYDLCKGEVISRITLVGMK
ncbi:MAG: hypothetical protein K0R98_1521 [Rickettsiaceae bacterium]|nr:hypothetical protein [Rickettsiaceae bacterium]